MSALYARVLRLVVGDIEIVHGVEKGLDVEFTIERSLQPEPNTAEIAIWNLNADHRSQLEEPDPEIPVQVQAGYDGQQAQIFLGTMRQVQTEHTGIDFITRLESGDGTREYEQSRISISLARGTTNFAAVTQAVKALGIAIGNLDAHRNVINARPQVYPSGGVLSGSASQILTRLCQSLSYGWSIQEGALQLLKLSEGVQATAVLLSPETGLVEAPSVDSDGILSARCLMTADIFPGRLMVLDSARLTGTYRIDQCRYIGSTFGREWYIDIEAEKL